jgi:streptogramin lyase
MNPKEFAVAGRPSGTAGVTVGPGGNLWFTAESGVPGEHGVIGRIKLPSGTAPEEFVIPADKTEEPLDLDGITAGPDGNLWFTNKVGANSDRIGRLNPKNPSEVEEFTLPAGNDLGVACACNEHTDADNIAAGPEGNMWFTEPGSHAIGIINTKGQFLQQIDVSTVPMGIAAGPGGYMWFTDGTGPWVIGRINAKNTSEVSEFPAPYPSGSIVEGPDGNMWFTEGASSTEDGVGCIIPSGQIELHPERTPGGNPSGIALAPDGSIWFSEENLKLARLYPALCGATPPPTTTPGTSTTTTTTSSTTTTPKGKPTTTPPLATVLGLPSAQQCLSRRGLVVHVHAPPGQKLLSVKLWLGRKVLRSETFTKTKNNKVPPTLIDLRGLPKGTFTLTIVVETKAGKTYRATRTYHACRPRKHE